MKKYNPIFIGVLQAFSIVLYVVLIDVLMSKIGSYLVSKSFIGVNLSALYGLLLLLVFSILVCGVITFMYPVNLIINKKIKEAVIVVTSMIISIGVILITVLLFLVFSGKTNLKTNLQQLETKKPNTYYINKATEAKQKAENERLEYEKRFNQNSDFKSESGDKGETIINTELKIYPYKININTGEKTPIEE